MTEPALPPVPPGWPPTAPWAAPAPEPPKAAKSSSTGLALGIFLLLALAAIGLLVVISTSSSSSSPTAPTTAATDFHDISTLEDSVTLTTDDNFTKKGLTFYVTSSICVQGASDSTFLCNLQYNDNTGETVTVTVAPDGQSWVSQ